jgi:hypothetical protein
LPSFDFCPAGPNACACACTQHINLYGIHHHTEYIIVQYIMTYSTTSNAVQLHIQ